MLDNETLKSKGNSAPVALVTPRCDASPAATTAVIGANYQAGIRSQPLTAFTAPALVSLAWHEIASHTFGNLIDSVIKPPLASSKEEARAIVFAHLERAVDSNITRRLQAQTRWVSAITLDLDFGDLSPAQIIELVQKSGLVGVVYASFNHGKTRTGKSTARL